MMCALEQRKSMRWINHSWTTDARVNNDNKCAGTTTPEHSMRWRTTIINALEQPLLNNSPLNSHYTCSWTTKTNTLEQLRLNNHWWTLRKCTVEQPRWNNHAGTSTMNAREQPLRNIHVKCAGAATLEHSRGNSVRWNTHAGTAKINALEQR